MKAAAKVLISCIVIAVVLVLIVFYRYNIIGGSSSTNETKEFAAQVQSVPSTSTEEKAQQADNNGSQENAVFTTVANKKSSVSSASLENGKKLYAEKTCALCHGVSGKADSPTGQAMKATDLTSGKFHNNKTNMEAVSYILNVIDNGVPGTSMASFKAQIPNEQDRKDLANYVHSLVGGK